MKKYAEDLVNCKRMISGKSVFVVLLLFALVSQTSAYEYVGFDKFIDDVTNLITPDSPSNSTTTTTLSESSAQSEVASAPKSFEWKYKSV